jgi:hypothetical protein
MPLVAKLGKKYFINSILQLKHKNFVAGATSEILIYPKPQ